MLRFIRVRTAARDVTFMNPTGIKTTPRGTFLVVTDDTGKATIFCWPYSLEYEDFAVTLDGGMP